MGAGAKAVIFGEIFEMLAENPTDDHKALAVRIFKMSQRYDFTNDEMEAGAACRALGVARWGTNPNYPEDGETTIWPGDEGYEEAQITTAVDPLPTARGGE